MQSSSRALLRIPGAVRRLQAPVPQDGSGIHNPRWIETRLDHPHCRKFCRIAVSLKIFDFHAADTMFGRKATSQFVNKVIDSAFYRLAYVGVLVPGTPFRREDVVVQVAVPNMTEAVNADIPQSRNPGPGPVNEIGQMRQR